MAKYTYLPTYRIKMKPGDAKSGTYMDPSKNIMIKVLNLKLLILLEHQGMLLGILIEEKLKMQ